MLNCWTPIRQKICKPLSTIKDRILDKRQFTAVEDSLTLTTKAQDHFQIRLPGFTHDPEWAKQMDEAIDSAAKIIDGDSQLLLKTLGNEENRELLACRARIPCRGDKEKMLEYVQNELNEFAHNPKSVRKICDYVLGNAHLRYMNTTPKYRQRGSIREICHHGYPREIVWVGDTPFSGAYQVNPYEPYKERALKHLESTDHLDGRMWGCFSRLKCYHFPEGGKWVYKEPSAERIGLNKTTATEWWPMQTEHLDRAWTHIDDIFQDILKMGKIKPDDQAGLQEAIGKVAEMQWWFSQAMPYARGSAAIGDVLSKLAFKKLGIKVPPYKIRTAPDLEAFVTPLPKFVQNYASLFEGMLEVSGR
jgi:hypothetical protein